MPVGIHFPLSPILNLVPKRRLCALVAAEGRNNYEWIRLGKWLSERLSVRSSKVKTRDLGAHRNSQAPLPSLSDSTYSRVHYG